MERNKNVKIVVNVVQILPYIAGVITALRGGKGKMDTDLLKQLSEKIEKLEVEVARLGGFVSAHHGMHDKEES